MLSDWLPFLIYAFFAAVIPATMIMGSFLFATRPTSRTKQRMIPFESGVSEGPPAQDRRFTVSFYLTAMLFILFDIEIVFLYPLAIQLLVVVHVRVKGAVDGTSIRIRGKRGKRAHTPVFGNVVNWGRGTTRQKATAEHRRSGRENAMARGAIVDVANQRAKAGGEDGAHAVFQQGRCGLCGIQYDHCAGQRIGQRRAVRKAAERKVQTAADQPLYDSTRRRIIKRVGGEQPYGVG